PGPAGPGAGEVRAVGDVGLRVGAGGVEVVIQRDHVQLLRPPHCSRWFQVGSMKFVVTGAVEPAARISSRCSVIAARISSELKRRKSISWAGLCRYCVARGGVISSQSP